VSLDVELKRDSVNAEVKNYRIPLRAIASGASAILSVACSVWVVCRPRRAELVSIIHQVGPTLADLVMPAGTLLAGLALGLCILSWKSEDRPVATGASIAAVHAVLVWIWLLLRI
jgi:hypothetical protein